MINKKTAFVGMTHMGICATAVWSSFPGQVVGVDENKKVINSLSKGSPGFFEKDLDVLFKRGRKKMTFTSDFRQLKNVSMVIFSEDTKLEGSNRMQRLDHLIDLAIPYLAENVVIVMMSQVPPGYCREVASRIKKARPQFRFSLYHWVDTIIMTQAVDRLINPERIIIGQSDKTEKIASVLVATLKRFKCPIFYMSFESAEMTKVAINMYLANSVTYANTLSDYCEVLGADINEVIPALRTDKRIGPAAYLRPTLRIAGGHIERDITLLKSIGAKAKLLPNVASVILDLNKNRFKWATKKLNTHIVKGVKNPKVAIWGLAYKKDSDSTLNAASIEIIKSLKAKINTYDPMAIMPKSVKGYKRYGDKYQAVVDADCLLILTEWDEFRDIDIKRTLKLMKNKLIIDCVGVLYEKKKLLKGFRYVCMGVAS